MAIREIIKRGDPVLNKKAHPVTKFDAKLAELLDDMRETLDEAGGAGLAAPQVGILRAVVLVGNSEDEVLELVNPTILTEEGEQDGLEGCLSIPGYWGFVKRPMKVTVKAQDRDGNWFEVDGEGFSARCFCHELDHLKGQLYVDLTDKLYTTEELEELTKEQVEEKLE